MALIAQLKSLLPAERKELLETLANASLRSAEAKTVLRLLQEVLEEHNALSEELSKNGTFRRQDYTRTLEGQSYSTEQVTHVARASLSMIPCR